MDPQLLKPTPYERLTYEGRLYDDIEQAKLAGRRYIGSVTFEFHLLQMRNHRSFIHRNERKLIKFWARKGKEARSKKDVTNSN